MSSPIVLAYWNIRGLAQASRYLLEYTGTSFENKVYLEDDAWFSEDKKDLGIPLANLPYLIDGNEKISQSFAILRHLGRKYGLVPSDEKNLIRVDMIEREAHDVQQKYGSLVYGSKDFENDKKTHATYVEVEMKKIEDFLGDKLFFGGENISYVDFFVYEVLDVHADLLGASYLDKFPKLKSYHHRIQNLPTIASYLKSDRFQAHPINGESAQHR